MKGKRSAKKGSKDHHLILRTYPSGKQIWWLKIRLEKTLVVESLGVTTKNEARKLRDDRIAELEQAAAKGQPLRKRDQVTVAEYAKDWLENHVKAERPSEKAYKLAEQRLKDHILPEVGHLPLGEVKNPQLKAVRSKLREKGLSDQTSKHVLSDLRCLLREAHADEIIDSVPSFMKIMPTIPKPGRNDLSDAQVQKILEVLHRENRPEDAWFVEVALETGLRERELHNLTWHQVKWELQPFLELVHTKSKRPRKVPLSTRAVELLKPLYQEALNKKRLPVGRVWSFDRRSADSIYHDSKRRFGFRWHFHQLRHTFGCRYYDRGGNLGALKEIMGHSTIQLTERYAKLSESSVFADAAKVDQRVQTGHAEGHVEAPAVPQRKRIK